MLSCLDLETYINIDMMVKEIVNKHLCIRPLVLDVHHMQDKTRNRLSLRLTGQFLIIHFDFDGIHIYIVMNSHLSMFHYYIFTQFSLCYCACGVRSLSFCFPVFSTFC